MAGEVIVFQVLFLFTKIVHFESFVLNPCLTGNVSQTWCYVTVSSCMYLLIQINQQTPIPTFYSNNPMELGSQNFDLKKNHPLKIDSENMILSIQVLSKSRLGQVVSI